MTSQKHLIAKKSKSEASPKEKENILIFCAHPDDEILGAGGTIAKYSEDGKHVVSVIFSYGEQGSWWLKHNISKEVRSKESLKAGKIVGTAETFFLGLNDLELKKQVHQKEVETKLKQLVKMYNPTKIFTHSKDDMIYSDHLAVYAVMVKILKEMDYEGDLFTFNIWGKELRSAENFKLFVDISKTFKYKIRALNQFKSQKLLVMWQLLPGIIWSAIVDGWINKCLFAEVFVKEDIK